MTGDTDAIGIGGKAGYTKWLIANGERVPATYVIRPDTPATEFEAAVSTHLAPSDRYAVRSSANVEDGIDASYAGQFTTRLDVEVGDVTAAVQAVRDSVGSN